MKINIMVIHFKFSDNKLYLLYPTKIYLRLLTVLYFLQLNYIKIVRKKVINELCKQVSKKYGQSFIIVKT